MIVTENLPSSVSPDPNYFRQNSEVVTKGAGCFWHSGEWHIPVERDGNRSWLVFTPTPSVPRVQTWIADDDGTLLRVPGEPAIGSFLVRTEMEDDVTVLSTAAIERRYNRG